MADHGTPNYSTAAGNDYAEHESTYNLFVWLTKWSVIIIAAILIAMFVFLT